MKNSLRRVCLALVLALLVCALPAAGLAKYNARLRKGTRISVMGDSISTYAGWSDIRPITGPESTYRYGEAYYGPAGGDYHNTDLLVSDTWWHQAAAQMGGQILVSNAANSSGLMRASYPSIPEWEQYLKDMRAYLTRPYYMGIGKIHPDIIALYIGSADVTASPSTFGSVSDINFSQLIQKTGKNSYTYAEPTTVAEAYSILLHKLQVTYPKAEIYCFTVVPNSGANTTQINTLLKKVLPFNEMVKEVAAHYNAFVVDIFDEFALDPNADGVATDADVQTFKSYFNGDPHPNAKGFDVITNRFVSTVMENSRFVVGNRKNPPAVTVENGTKNVNVETKAGKSEPVKVSYTIESEAPMARSSGNITIRTNSEAVDYLTPAGQTVNYSASSVQTTNAAGLTIGTSSSAYTSANKDGYWAEGGSESSVQTYAPAQDVAISLIEGSSVTIPSQHPTKVQVSGDVKTSLTDGTYDYTETLLTQQGSVTVTTEGVAFEKKESSSDMRYVVNQTPNTAENDMVIEPPTTVNSPDNATIQTGFDFQYIGSDKYSRFWSAHVHSTPGSVGDKYYIDIDSKRFYLGAKLSAFTNNGYQVPKYYFYDDEDIETGDLLPARYEHIQHFTLVDRNKNLLSAYCADKDTPAAKGYNYIMKNLEDAGYYTEEDARRIRVVANNGYWGAPSGFGSLQAVRKMLVDDGVLTSEEAAKLTNGMAMTATQYAIWSCSNAMSGVEFVHAYYVNEANVHVKRHADENQADLIFKLFFHLLDLAKDAPIPETNTANTVITEKNFLKDVSLSLSDKPESLEENLDADPNNDVYMADISFTLGVKPLDGNDDNLAVTIEDGNGNILSAGRIVGDLKNGETRLKPDANGRYTLSGVEICEEAIQSIIIRMHGTQDLNKDVYLFTSEEKNGETSQTMVGVAEGDYGVNVLMNLSFSLDVTDDVFSIKRFWRTEHSLPVNPQTGDPSALLPWLILLAACACSAALLKKKAVR